MIKIDLIRFVLGFFFLGWFEFFAFFFVVFSSISVYIWLKYMRDGNYYFVNISSVIFGPSQFRLSKQKQPQKCTINNNRNENNRKNCIISMIKNSIFININKKEKKVAHISHSYTNAEIFKRSVDMNFLRVAHFYYSYYQQYYIFTCTCSPSLAKFQELFLLLSLTFIGWHELAALHRNTDNRTMRSSTYARWLLTVRSLFHLLAHKKEKKNNPQPTVRHRPPKLH